MTLHDHKPGAPTTLARGIVIDETNSGKPSKGDFERMARRRFQDPKPKREGKWWYLLYWRDEFENGRRTRKRRRIKLAPATMPEREVRKIAAETLRPMNQGLTSVGSAIRFTDFVEEMYKPTMLPLLSKAARERSVSVLKIHLLPMFGQSSLRDMGPHQIQRYLSGLANSAQSDESRKKIRSVLSSVLGSAVRFGYLEKNPAEGLKLPPAKKGRRMKPYITIEQFEAMLVLMSEPYQTMVFVAGYTGFRVSELIGLKWRCVHEDSITIDERFCRGDWGAPKSDASNATVPVKREVVERLQLLKTLTVEVKAGNATRSVRAVKSNGPDDLVFPSLEKGGPMRDNNILVRHLKPAGEKVGIGFVNWQVLRRSFATWLNLSGANVKDSQALMRHSRASTTMDIYTQFVPDSQRRAVDNLGRPKQPILVN
jgi:integrase